MIQISDTHRLVYRNATLKAYLYSNQSTRINFYDPDGESLGDTLQTNDKGFICAGTGTDVLQGYFVQNKALIVCTLSDGTTVQWVTGEDISGVVNDGRLLGLNDEEIFSANQEADSKTFDYLKLLNQPKLKPWQESQLTVAVGNTDGTDAWGSSVSVPKQVTVLKIQDLADCLTGLKCSYRKCIVLKRPVRPGQQLMVVSETGSDTILLNEGVAVPDSESDEQYTNAISVLDAYEGVALAAVYTRNDVYEWQAVSKTRLFDLNSGANGLQYVNMGTSAVTSAAVRKDAKVVIVSQSSGQDSSLQLVFSRAGQNVIVVNNSFNKLYLCNVLPTTVSQESSVCVLSGMTASPASSASRRSVAAVGSGVIGDGVIRFWGLGTNADSYVNGVSGGTVQRVTFRPIAEVSGNVTLNLGDLRIDPYAESLEISVDVSGISVTSSAVHTIGFSVYVYGGADGQVLGVATPRLYAKPTLASGVSEPAFGTLAIGQHQSVKISPYVSGNASTVKWENADFPTYVHGGIPVNSWAVDGSTHTKCATVLIARCSHYTRSVSNVFGSGESEVDTTTVIDMRYTPASASGSSSDNTELWSNPSPDWTSAG